MICKKCCLIIFIFFTFFLCSIAADRTYRLQLVWHHQFQFAGYYMALEKGFYAEAGLDVEILPVKKDSTPINEVLSNNADFGITTSGVVLNYFDGYPLVSVAAIFQKSPLVFITKADSGIETIWDMEGRKVMLLDDMSSLELVSLLKKYGMLNKIIRQPSSFEIQDIIDGRTEVFNGYRSNEPYELESKNVKTNIIDPFDYGVKFYGDILFTTSQMIFDYPEDVEAFKQASIRGWKYALAHTEEAIDVIKNVYNSPKTKAHLRYEANIIQELTQYDLVPLGFQSSERWEQIADMLMGIGVVGRTRDLSGFIYEAPEAINWEQMKAVVFVFTIVLLLVVLWRYITLFNAKKTILEKENMMILQSKYAALGEMLGAITHQLKQPLNGISIILQNIEDSSGRKDEQKWVGHGLELVQHMSATIDGFRMFYRNERMDREFSVALSVCGAFELSSGYLKYYNINYILSCSCGKRETLCDPSNCEDAHKHCDITLYGNSNEFKQVIMNLIQNSREALMNLEQEEKEIRVNLAFDGELIRIEFSDNGPGIQPEILDQIFEPDFTEKDDGTGLGLYMSKKIVEDHYNGTIRAENADFGARFIISFPVN
ncbi:integral membrane sensor signal transduction histidine kinase [Denitrovibrio acetiphilus DSM 12809]|uniref:histidine kinase n=1 Tax=Denitrovibrio acetiphilus (strain DSM 12809 / NBRC 114555 / N2460) TaxID=522772 RepID=D4H5D7_DENA2|nr:ABC transporter substrate-binding protein [Denitrovibrio acetiphilus]ADD67557.1 integral membrane sensor signal transduction histidine kinase [Denitrovibrio acetiphilus DSM 12809]